MTTEALIGARIPDQSDGPLGGLQIGNALRDLIPYAIPRFATTSARDAAYSAWVAAGGTMANGMTCWCDDVGAFFDRVGGAWVRRTNNAGTSGVLAGTAPPAGLNLAEKTYYAAVTLNANGDGTVVYPGGAFPNGVTKVSANHVSQGGPPSNDIKFRAWNVGLGSLSLRCYGPGGAVFGGTGVPVVVTIKGW